MDRLRPASYFTLGVSCRCSRPVRQKTGGVGNEIQFSPDNKLTIRALEMVWERQGSTTGKK